jgi:hypothetical protein
MGNNAIPVVNDREIVEYPRIKAHHSEGVKSPITFPPKTVNGINGIVGVVVVVVGIRRFVLVLPRATPRAPVTNEDVAGSGSGTFLLATVNKQRISPVFEHRTEDVEIY